MKLTASSDRAFPPRAGWALLAALVYQCPVFSGTGLFTAGWRLWAGRKAVRHEG